MTWCSLKPNERFIHLNAGDLLFSSVEIGMTCFVLHKSDDNLSITLWMRGGWPDTHNIFVLSHLPLLKLGWESITRMNSGEFRLNRCGRIDWYLSTSCNSQ